MPMEAAGNVCERGGPRSAILGYLSFCSSCLLKQNPDRKKANWIETALSALQIPLRATSAEPRLMYNNAPAASVKAAGLRKTQPIPAPHDHGS